MTQNNETILDFYAVTKELRIFAESNGMSVVYKRDSDNSVPSANSRGQIEIPQPQVWWSKEQLLEWKWMCYHEIGHQVSEMRDTFPLLQEKQLDLSKQSLFGGIYNILDDHRQERHHNGWYPGRDQVLSKGGAEFMRNQMVPKFEEVDMNQQDEMIQMLDTMVGGDATLRTSWQPDYIGVDTLYQDHFSEQQKKWLGKLLSLKRDVDSLETAEDVYDLTKRIVSEVFEKDEQEEEQKAQGEPDQGQQGADGEGDQEGKGKGSSGRGDGSDGEDGDSTDGGEGEGDKRDSEAHVKYEDLFRHDHTEDHEGASYHPLTIDYSDYDPSKHVRFDPCTDPEVFDFVNSTGTPNTSTEYAQKAASMNIGTGLSNRIRKLLQVKSQAIQLYGQKKGKIAGKSLYRGGMVDSGDYQQRVFRKKIDNNILDTAVTILADFSGSMGGDKQLHSIASALMLNDSLAKIGVPVELLGFTDRGGRSTMYKFKEHKKPISRDKLIEYMGRASSYSMAGNADGEAIAWSYDRLRRQTNKRKLLIVLSDGQPAASRGGDIYGYTKEVIESIENRRDVEIYGIGIQSSAVKDLYSHNRVIHRSSELEEAILNVIKDYIIN
jgi:cobalamin biosynthesis protein CobT